MKFPQGLKIDKVSDDCFWMFLTTEGTEEHRGCYWMF